MFYVTFIKNGRKYIRPVVSVDRPTNAFLIVNEWDEFEWVDMDICRYGGLK